MFPDFLKGAGNESRRQRNIPLTVIKAKNAISIQFMHTHITASIILICPEPSRLTLEFKITVEKVYI
jgi:hypothetical protein